MQKGTVYPQRSNVEVKIYAVVAVEVLGRLRAPPVRVCFFRAATSAARTGFGFMVLILRLCQLKSLTVISFTSYIVAESVSKQKLF